MTPSPIHTIRGGEIIPTLRGKTVTKGTTTMPAKGEMASNANTLTKDSKVRGSDNNPAKIKEAEVEVRRV